MQSSNTFLREVHFHPCYSFFLCTKDECCFLCSDATDMTLHDQLSQCLLVWNTTWTKESINDCVSFEAWHFLIEAYLKDTPMLTGQVTGIRHTPAYLQTTRLFDWIDWVKFDIPSAHLTVPRHCVWWRASLQHVTAQLSIQYTRRQMQIMPISQMLYSNIKLASFNQSTLN